MVGARLESHVLAETPQQDADRPDRDDHHGPVDDRSVTGRQQQTNAEADRISTPWTSPPAREELGRVDRDPG